MASRPEPRRRRVDTPPAPFNKIAPTNKSERQIIQGRDVAKAHRLPPYVEDYDKETSL